MRGGGIATCTSLARAVIAVGEVMMSNHASSLATNVATAIAASGLRAIITAQSVGCASSQSAAAALGKGGV